MKNRLNLLCNPSDIFQSINEFDSLTEEKFLEKYNFTNSYSIIFKYKGKLYPAIPVVIHAFNINKNNVRNKRFYEDTYLEDNIKENFNSVAYYLNKSNSIYFQDFKDFKVFDSSEDNKESIFGNTKLLKYFIDLISKEDNNYLKKFNLDPLSNYHFNFNNKVPENIENITKRINYLKSKSTEKCIYEDCNLWLSQNSTEGFCKNHAKQLGVFNKHYGRWKRLSELNLNQLDLRKDEEELINFIYSKFNELSDKSSEYWTIFKITFLVRSRWGIEVGFVKKELENYVDSDLDLTEEVQAIYDMFYDFLDLLEIYFAKSYVENIKSIDSLIKKNIIEKNSNQDISYNLLTTYWKESEYIKNSCSFKKSTPCKSRLGKIKKLFKTKEYAVLYMRKNQYYYFCENSGLGYHIASLRR